MGKITRDVLERSVFCRNMYATAQVLAAKMQCPGLGLRATGRGACLGFPWPGEWPVLLAARAFVVSACSTPHAGDLI